MPKTLLAVDDSATMRKVLEITFVGEDFRVVTADSAAGALAKLAEEPAVAVIDASLGNDDGYALAKEVRARSPRATILLLTSRYSPYDSTRGRDAGVDDSADKPFDTQALIEKVKKAISAREAVKSPAATSPSAVAASPVVAGPSAPTPTMNVTAAFGSAPRPTQPGASAGGPAAPGQAPKAWPAQRTHTLSFEGGPAAGSAPSVSMPAPLSRTSPSGVMPAPPASSPAPTSAPSAAPMQTDTSPGATTPGPTLLPTARSMAFTPPSAPNAHALPTAAPPPAREAPVAAPSLLASNGQLGGKLHELGLTPAQIDGVLALSREIVERVVWEVVPSLAETLIKEELARLTKES